MKSALSICFLGLAFLMGGCASASLSPLQKRVAKIAVQAATLKVIDGREDRAEKAVRIIRSAKSALRGETATTAQALVDLARRQIDFSKLDAEDQLLVRLLLNEVQAELEHRLGPELLGADRALAIAEVLDWIASAAQPYTLDSSPAPPLGS